MGKGLFMVLSSRGQWYVDFEGRNWGPFQTREAAALEARSQAKNLSRSGRICEVIVPDDRGQRWVIWSSTHTERGDKPFVPHKAGRSWLDSRGS